MKPVINNYSSWQPLQVGMLIGAYAPDPEGGAERQCRLLSQALIARRYAVQIITIRRSWRVSQTAEEKRSIVHRIGHLGPAACIFLRALESYMMKVVSSNDPALTGIADRRARALAFWFSLPVVWLSRLEFLLDLRRFMTKGPKPFDILHVHESGWLAGVGIALGKRWHIPVICKEATAPALGPIGYDTPFRRKWDQRRRSADAWLAQTSTIRDELVALGITPDRIHLLSNGVVMPSETAMPECSKDLLYVGNLTQGASWKAFDVLFDAWIRIAKKRNDARLIVAGDGDPRSWISILERQDVKDTVEFMGHVKDPSSFYHKAGIFVLPSRVEGMSNALLEAMSWGLPCVVSDIPGNLSVIDNEVNGLIVPVNDAGSLAEAILRLMNNPTLRSSIGANARKKIELTFDIQCVTDRLDQIYRAVLGEHSSVEHK